MNKHESTVQLPDASNFFATVGGEWSAEAIAKKYQRAGWTVRRMGRDEWEALCDVVDLDIESTSPVLIHGRVGGQKGAAVAVHELERAGLSFTAELYSAIGVLISVYGGTRC